MELEKGNTLQSATILKILSLILLSILICLLFWLLKQSLKPEIFLQSEYGMVNSILGDDRVGIRNEVDSDLIYSWYRTESGDLLVFSKFQGSREQNIILSRLSPALNFKEIMPFEISDYPTTEKQIYRNHETIRNLMENVNDGISLQELQLSNLGLDAISGATRSYDSLYGHLIILRSFIQNGGLGGQ